MPEVLVIVPFAMPPDTLEKRGAQLRAVRLGPDIDFTFEAVRIAPERCLGQQNRLLADVGILQAGHDAQTRGFGAVVIDMMSDSGDRPRQGFQALRPDAG